MFGCFNTCATHIQSICDSCADPNHNECMLGLKSIACRLRSSLLFIEDYLVMEFDPLGVTYFN